MPKRNKWYLTLFSVLYLLVGMTTNKIYYVTSGWVYIVHGLTEGCARNPNQSYEAAIVGIVWPAYWFYRFPQMGIIGKTPYQIDCYRGVFSDKLNHWN